MATPKGHGMSASAPLQHGETSDAIEKYKDDDKMISRGMNEHD
jgi:hypothetical protein